MSLLCLGSYIAIGLLLTSVYWMSLIVGRKHDEETGSSRIHKPAYGGD